MLTELASTIERVFPHTNTYFTIVLIYFLVVFFSSHIEKVGFSRIQGIFIILPNVKQHLRTAIQRCPIWDNAESAFSYFYGKYSWRFSLCPICNVIPNKPHVPFFFFLLMNSVC